MCMTHASRTEEPNSPILGGSWLNSRLRDAAAGMRTGLAIALIISVIVTAAYVLTDGSGLRRLGMSLPAVIGLYLGGGALAGSIVGLLRARVNSRGAAILVGAIAAFPVCICVYV